MDYFTAIILGLVQGATEFLPVSSSGHLVLVQDFLNQDTANSLAYAVVLHLATMSAIILYFRKDIWVLLQTVVRLFGRLPVNQKDVVLIQALALGTIPAVLIGLAFDSIISTYLQAAPVVVGALVVSSLFFMYAEWYYYNHPPASPLTPRSGFLIGCFQVLALIPGFSRSGATLCGGMLLGFTRVEAARFSFLLAIPVILGAGVLKLFELITTGGAIAWTPLLIGAAVSFIVALTVIHFFLGYLAKHTLWPFIWYKLILALVVGYVVFIV